MDKNLIKSYEALDKFWDMKVREDNKMWINFITYFKSEETVMKAFKNLPFAKVERGVVKLPEGFIAKLHLMKDLNRIVLVYLMGNFTKSQARKVISTFSHFIDQDINDKYLPEVASKFALALQQKGGGGLVWTDWPEITENQNKKPFWKIHK